MATTLEVYAKAKSLGAVSITHGINWTWANGFPNQEAGLAFIAWLDENGIEHRGFYDQSGNLGNGVRFR